MMARAVPKYLVCVIGPLSCFAPIVLIPNLKG